MDFKNKKIFVEESAIQRNDSLALTTADDGDAKGKGETEKGKVFEMSYDKLVVAVGCYSQTFGTKGVKENALFLKDVGDARKIRKRILDCKSVIIGCLSVISADIVEVLKRRRYLRHLML